LALLEKGPLSQKTRQKFGGDSFLKIVLALAAVAVVGLLLALAGELANSASPSLSKFGLSFLWGSNWDPGNNVFGALPFIYGTALTSGLALLFALPVSIGVAIFLTEKIHHLPAVGNLIGTLVELLAAVPSVIYGLWALIVLSPAVKKYVEIPLNHYAGSIPLFACTPFGLDFFTAGLILAIMIIPTIAAVTRDILNAVPNSQREALYALGATNWEVIRRSVIPYARSGIFGATILGLGRAVGETMAVTMVIGNVPKISGCLFSGGYTLSSLLANQFFEATGSIMTSSLIEIGLVLFLLALVINIGARAMIWRITGGVRSRV
jgi:phosphate transport system permease protein